MKCVPIIEADEQTRKNFNYTIEHFSGKMQFFNGFADISENYFVRANRRVVPHSEDDELQEWLEFNCQDKCFIAKIGLISFVFGNKNFLMYRNRNLTNNDALLMYFNSKQDATLFKLFWL
jgi:hypothetical protein